MTDNINDRILGKDVVVSLSGLPQGGEQSDQVEIMCPGEYHYRDGKHYITYDETTDPDGHKPDTHCILKISEKEIELIKRGDVTTHMFFAPGSPTVSVYSTPFGDITIETNVSSLELYEDRHLLRADMLYTLEMNYDYAQECHLTITVTD